VALEHLRIHSELCAMKWANPTTWLKEGFAVRAAKGPGM
jgi:hypothetical protein